MEWEEAQEIKQDIIHILSRLDLPHIDPQKISCYRTSGSTAKAYARIWAFPKIFQRALNIEPHYVIEILSKYFDKLDANTQKKVLIHELLHIPKNFSGSLLSHKSNGRNLGKLANALYKTYLTNIKAK